MLGKVVPACLFHRLAGEPPAAAGRKARRRLGVEVFPLLVRCSGCGELFGRCEYRCPFCGTVRR